MEGFTQLSSGMCSIRTLLQGKHQPLLCQAVQFSAAFNHKKGRANVKRRGGRGGQQSAHLPSPSLYTYTKQKKNNSSHRFSSTLFLKLLKKQCPYSSHEANKSSLTESCLSNDVRWMMRGKGEKTAGWRETQSA